MHLSGTISSCKLLIIFFGQQWRSNGTEDVDMSGCDTHKILVSRIIQELLKTFGELYLCTYSFLQTLLV